MTNISPAGGARDGCTLLPGRIESHANWLGAIALLILSCCLLAFSQGASAQASCNQQTGENCAAITASDQSIPVHLTEIATSGAPAAIELEARLDCPAPCSIQSATSASGAAVQIVDGTLSYTRAYVQDTDPQGNTTYAYRSGPDVVSYTLSDGTTRQISVFVCAAQPCSYADAASSTPPGMLEVITDTDADGNPHKVLRFTPNYDLLGQAVTLNYTVVDATAQSTNVSESVVIAVPQFQPSSGDVLRTNTADQSATLSEVRTGQPSNTPWHHGIPWFVGSNGPNGGGAPNVRVTNSGAIDTGTAPYASGIVAGSIGGAGGGGEHGGILLGIFYGAAGNGGWGGAAGRVVVENTGEIQTNGAHSVGILAQSIGGVGGNGGSNAIGIASKAGNGGAGAPANTVLVDNSGRVTTLSSDSDAIRAESRAGHGGIGGTNIGHIYTGGGAGGSGGASSGQVIVSNSGDLSTSVERSRGIFAQSVGGGGGNGGNAYGIWGSGADGGGAGHGGATFDEHGVRIERGVVVANSGTIATTSATSDGIFAQSVGGGGGGGGDAGGWFAVGGDGTAAGNGYSVSVNTSGDSITTGGADSNGIFAQSVGGGGGGGGSAVALGAFGSLAIGGNGGDGGTGGEVSVNNGGDITTGGARSDGIHAQSVGGGGGAGGFAFAGSVGVGASASYAIGGSGAGGGNSDDVSVTSVGDIRADGEESSAIFAQSLGGGGGSGGFSIAASAADSYSLSFALGGRGGTGGTSGDVNVGTDASVVTGDIDTVGARSFGILAQSLGGGGGNGGFAVAGGAAIGASMNLSVGGAGGTGGNSGSVSIDSAAAIDTEGAGSHAIFAQSVGGGGGTGGFSVAAGLAAGLSVNAGFGGSGGAGGHADSVDVASAGNITTLGERAYGVFAQSVGGGGGAGGFSIAAGASTGFAASLALGGAGAAGNQSASVSVYNSGTIDTGSNSNGVVTGHESIGLLAQSVGGGGGAGGFSLSANAGQAAASLSFGGEAGAGGYADTVDVTTLAEHISTWGDRATAVLAQSVGGGGGTGGFSIGASAGQFSGSFSMGGAAGNGGEGKEVTLFSTSDITTRGRNSAGLIAQSIGGGGGAGGFSVGASLSSSGGAAFGLGGAGGAGADSGGVTIGVTGENEQYIAGTINTSGERSYGVLAQSVGGGGGDGGFSVAGSLSVTGPSGAFSLGGSGGVGGESQTVTVLSAANITTTSRDSHALVAQSIGGGGGSGGFSVAAGLSAGSAAAGVSLGGAADSGGKSEAVTVRNRGTIATRADNSYGVLAQSVGGGGGTGGFAIGASAGAGFSGSLGLGGSGGGGKTSAAVDVHNTGDIDTGASTNGVITGHDSYGIFAQSVGGGGGAGGFSVAAGAGQGAIGLSFGGSGAGGGDAGSVGVTTLADRVTTWGDRATAVLVQSVGGGGGAGGFSVGASAGQYSGAFSMGGGGANGGLGNTASLFSTSDVTTHGDDALGIFVQSVGGGGGAGGFSVGASLSTSAGIAASLGGAGGTGAAADTVTVGQRTPSSIDAIEGDITTYGERSVGVLAQSVGGGGGRGGFSVAGSLSVSGSTPVGAFSLGGGGGPGAPSGAVDVVSAANVATSGTDAHGIVAQSIAGGGGNGGFSVAAGIAPQSASVGISIGGGAGVGAVADDVMLDSRGTIRTRGNHAYGLFAQSVGGGGGDGGFSVGASLGAGVGVSVGGRGGSANDAGEVRLTNSGSIMTGVAGVSGDGAHGIFAQSVGGGGGSGGFSVGAAAGLFGGSLSFGGNGADGGDAKLVAVTTTGASIETFGARSFGVLAQSVGGGGGDGGFSASGSAGRYSGSFSLGGGSGTGGLGDEVTLFSTSTVTTRGNDSHGLFAQSIGGGGGSGGFSVAGSFSSDGGAAISVGGFSGDGAKSGAVSVGRVGEHEEFIGGSVTTFGQRAYGVFAQSVGGGGGDGGFSVGASLSIQGPSGAFSLGGSGGKGGTADEVTVLSAADVTTTGRDAHGIVAQSVGGGGGSGGFSVAAGIAPQSMSAGISIGGFADDGGTASDVRVHNRGVIATGGEHAYGVLAQSIGGGGGDGGFSVAGTLAQQGSLGFSLGGFGGTGGASGSAAVNNEATIRSSGERSTGILAQSIGGGGGSGGTSVAATFGLQESKNFAVSLGGFGGDGGLADTVDVSNSGSVVTSGRFAHGIQAQSIGGGGGNGGTSVATSFGLTGAQKTNVNLGVTLGGFGGDGNAAGAVTVGNGGTIVTRGDDAIGIYAQSIGGGGGDGGSAVTATVGIDVGKDGKSTNLAAAVGGFAGDGAQASTVTITNDGVIDTSGDESHGVLAQSIGGGGGNGGSARTISLVLGGEDEEEESDASSKPDDDKKKKAQENKSLQVAVGGFGGDGAISGGVNVTTDGLIVTRGADAHGIFAQSIGGGGGSGGNGAHGVPEELPIPTVINDELQQQLEQRDKIGNLNLSVVVGGMAGTGNDGGAVTIHHTGDIATLNSGSFGVLAQSIGAGGGIGGAGVIGEGNVGIGGRGGAAGDGKRVDVTIDGNIDTVGTNSHGVFAQSIGGGGGVAGDLDFGAIDEKDDDGFDSGFEAPKFNIGIGLNGGSAGDGGVVALNTTGNITTRGHAANGIFAQSIGGGGGAAGDSGYGMTHDILNLLTCIVECDALVGSAGGDGSGGAIAINHTGLITTFGAVAHGIFAQSAGGRADGVVASTVRTDADGAPVDAAGNEAQSLEDLVYDEVRDALGVPVALPDRVDRGGTIDITIDGGVIARGADANGIFAQSVGGDGNGRIAIAIEAGGLVLGGTAGGAGIRFKDGDDNVLVNRGGVTGWDGFEGLAIFGGAADETIENYGVVSGSVDLGAGANGWVNRPGAMFNLGAHVDLNGGLLDNAGAMSPGGTGTVATSALNAALTTDASSLYLVDLDMQAGRADRIDVDGPASIGGAVSIGLVGAPVAQVQEHVLVSAATLADAGALLTSQLPPALIANLAWSSQSQLLLTLKPDYSMRSAGVLKPNQRAIANYLNEVVVAGPSAASQAILDGMLAMTRPSDITGTLDRLQPESHLSAFPTAGFSNLRFADALQSCPSRDGAVNFLTETSCTWMRMATREFDQDDADGFMGFEQRAFELAGGAQRAFADRWFAGYALSYERSSNEVDEFADVDGSQVQAGAVLKRIAGASKLSLGVSMGYGWLDAQRRTGLPTAPMKAESSQDLYMYGLHFRAAHDFGSDRLYIRPILDIGFARLRLDGFTEHGAAGANLDVRAHGESFAALRPQVEIGAEFAPATGLWLRPFLRVGITSIFSDDTPELRASLADAPATSGEFEISSRIEDDYADVAIGLDLFGDRGISFAIGYNGQFSSSSDQQGVSAKLRAAF